MALAVEPGQRVAPPGRPTLDGEGGALCLAGGGGRERLPQTEPNSRRHTSGQRREAVAHKGWVLCSLKRMKRYKLLIYNEQQISQRRARFGAEIPGGAEVFCARFAGADGGETLRVELPHGASAVRVVAPAGGRPGGAGKPAFGGRGGDRRELLWAAPGAGQTGPWRGRQNPRHRLAQAWGKRLSQRGQELLQG